MKSYNMISTEKLQKCKHCHPEKFININSLRAKKYYLLVKANQQDKPNLHILLSEKLWKNKQVDALRSLNISDKTNE